METTVTVTVTSSRFDAEYEHLQRHSRACEWRVTELGSLRQVLVTLCVAVSAALAQYQPFRQYQGYRQGYPQGYPQYQQYQQYQQRAAAAPILQYSNDLYPDGSFQYR